MSKAIDLLLTPNMCLSVSGRRSGGPAYEEHSADQLGLWIDRLRPDMVMSGMALGIDLLAADIALDRDRPLYAVSPGEWQTNRWNQEQRHHWRTVMSQAKRTKFIDDGDLPGGQKSQSHVLAMFHERNRFMATHSTLTLVCWDGVPSGGTYNMLRICREVDQPVLLVVPGEATRLLCDAKALARAITRPVSTDVIIADAAVALMTPARYWARLYVLVEYVPRPTENPTEALARIQAQIEKHKNVVRSAPSSIHRGGAPT